MSAANGILSVLRAWSGACGSDQLVSLAVLCSGEDVIYRLISNHIL